MSDNCARLHELCSALASFNFPFEATDVPANGIYILFEEGEEGHGANRIVRVGTHRGTNRLRSRLDEHFLRENKDRSIFRKNIGRALLNHNKDPFLHDWNLCLTSRTAREKHLHKIDLSKQREVELQVTTYIQKQFSFAAFQIDSGSIRKYLESRIIATVSLCKECRPSQQWLGLHSSEEKIRESGLWLKQHLYRAPLSEDDFSELEKHLV